MSQPAVAIVAAKRTPIGNMLASLSGLSAAQLGSIAIKAALAESKLAAEHIENIIMGCVLTAGQGQAPARQAALAADLPLSCPATTINKMCGSGMQSLILTIDQINAGSYKTAIAGGMESMSNAPYLLPRARQGYRLGHGQLVDHMMLDGLEDAYQAGQSMGVFAEQTASRYQLSREQQDEFALSSLSRAQQATEKGWFNNELVPIEISNKKTSQLIDKDDGPRFARPEKIPQLKPAFVDGGTVTAANASSISDGAAALILMPEHIARAEGYQPLARIVGHASHAKAPSEFTTAPIGAMEKLFDKISWQKESVDLFEINEAFAVVTLAAMRDLALPHEKVNVNGGACALGHPIGASGARIIVTLLHALKQRKLSRGVASLCIGGGEATAIAIENID